MTTPVIKPLTDIVVNQIAAGEVIERPASVVKELIENSIDAGATQIDVRLLQGGIRSIEVSDDGRGIGPPDLVNALRRHYTSKLSQASELERIATLGFRGEALASIAAVADVQLISKARGAAHAAELHASAGVEGFDEPRPVGHKAGTRVVVNDLFAKLPARRRFLKRPKTEFLHIQRVVRQLVFARPDIAFSLALDGRTPQRFPRANDDPRRRWSALFGKSFVEQAHRCELADEAYSITGWIGGYHDNQSSSEWQFIALNGRVIRDRQLGRSIRLAYGDDFAAGRFPRYALRIDVPLGEVDINVHPGKTEVRFAQPREINDRLYSAVKRALEATNETVFDFPVVPALGKPRRSGADLIRETSTAVYQARALSPGNTGSSAPGFFKRVSERHYVFEWRGKLLLGDLEKIWELVIQTKLTSAATGAIAARPLLIPQICRFDLTVDVVRALASLGCEFDQLGEAQFALRTVPSFLPLVDERVVVSKFVELLVTKGYRAAICVALAQGVVSQINKSSKAAEFFHVSRFLDAVGGELESSTVVIDGELAEMLLEKSERKRC
ncbi:MAG: DNA mismatch repair endonuclease MutL [Pseudomonadota bacterium]